MPIPNSKIYQAAQAGALQSIGDIALAVNGATGSDAPTTTRPDVLTGGDYQAYPFATIQAAIDAVPQMIRHNVNIYVAAGSYAGFDIKGYNAGQGSLVVNGAQTQVTPTTGSASGTASSGTAKTLTLTSAGWTVDDFVGKFCKITSGTGAGQHFIIAENTADTLLFVGRMSPAPDATSVFEITEPSVILTSGGGFGAGAYVTGCIGAIGVYDMHVEGPSFGAVQLTSQNSFTVRRMTAKNCYYGFVAQDSLRVAFNQIGSLGSTSDGITLLSMNTAGNQAFEKGWMAINAGVDANGIRVSYCSAAGCQGLYAKGCGNNGIVIEHTAADLHYVVADGNDDGIWVTYGGRWNAYDVESKNNTKRGVGTSFGSRVDLAGTISGSGNGTWGAQTTGVGDLFTLIALPTMTGTSGDCSVDGSTAKSWSADLANANDYVENVARGARIVRAS